jgi:hypothetical protein
LTLIGGSATNSHRAACGVTPMIVV